ncbi:MAG: alpha/beta hydrolase-fold protein [Bacteroidales bacterium]|jgi:enterochelin esterase family protein
MIKRPAIFQILESFRLPAILAVILYFLIGCSNQIANKNRVTDNCDDLVRRLSNWTDSKTIKPTLYNSPTIEKLKKANEIEIKQFWDSIASKGTPLVEKCNDINSLIFTFLYRSKEKSIKVHIDIKNGYLENGDMMLLPIRNTDIWYRTYRIPADWTTSYRFDVTDNSGTINLTDKYNRHLIPIGLDTSYSYNAFDYFLDSSKVWFYEKKGVSKGTLAEFAIESKILKNSRSVIVYKPFEYDESKEYPSIVIFDQSLYLKRVPLPTILDNLIADNKIPPCVAIMVDNQPRERRELELPLYKPFADFIALELMPWAYQNFKITKDPNKSIVAGVSYGGLASSYIALNYSNLFGNVLSQSGSYWRGIKVTDSNPWLTEQYKSSPKLPIRFYMDCGLQETVMSSFSNFNFIENHRHMRDVLKLKGYEIYYQEFQSGHDWTGWRKTLPDGLIVLFAKMKK